MRCRYERNIVVKAVSTDATPGFDVIVLFSGIPEFVMHHRRDGMLFKLLCNGVRLDDLRRTRVRQTYGTQQLSRRISAQYERAVKRLLADVDKYLAVREAYSFYATAL